MELALLKIEVKELINAANRAANIKPLTPANERDVTLIVRLNSRTHIWLCFRGKVAFDALLSTN